MRRGRWYLGLSLLACATAAQAEDGYRLWMRYAPATASQTADPVSVRGEQTPMLAAAAAELRRANPAGLGPVMLARATDPAVAALRLPVATLGDEGYLVRSVTIDGRPVTLVTGTDRGIIFFESQELRHKITEGNSATVF